jgi:hypothetical protein
MIELATGYSDLGGVAESAKRGGASSLLTLTEGSGGVNGAGEGRCAIANGPKCQATVKREDEEIDGLAHEKGSEEQVAATDGDAMK